MAIDRSKKLRRDLTSLAGWTIVGIDGPSTHYSDAYVGLRLERGDVQRDVVLGCDGQDWWLEADSTDGH